MLATVPSLARSLGFTTGFIGLTRFPIKPLGLNRFLVRGGIFPFTNLGSIFTLSSASGLLVASIVFCKASSPSLSLVSHLLFEPSISFSSYRLSILLHVSCEFSFFSTLETLAGVTASELETLVPRLRLPLISPLGVLFSGAFSLSFLPLTKGGLLASFEMGSDEAIVASSFIFL